MKGFHIASAALLFNVPTDWEIAALADLDGDGRFDIVWRNTTTGENMAWLMDGTTVLSTALLTTLPVEWVLASP